MAVMAVCCSTGVESIGRITERDVARYGEKQSAVKDEVLEITFAKNIQFYRKLINNKLYNYDNEIFIAKISMANSLIYDLGIDCPYTRV